MSMHAIESLVEYSVITVATALPVRLWHKVFAIVFIIFRTN